MAVDSSSPRSYAPQRGKTTTTKGADPRVCLEPARLPCRGVAHPGRIGRTRRAAPHVRRLCRARRAKREPPGDRAACASVADPPQRPLGLDEAVGNCPSTRRQGSKMTMSIGGLPAGVNRRGEPGLRARHWLLQGAGVVLLRRPLVPPLPAPLHPPFRRRRAVDLDPAPLPVWLLHVHRLARPAC